MVNFPVADVLLLIVAGHVIFKARRSSFVSEAFNFMGVLLATVISLHYFIALGRIIHNGFGVEAQIALLISFTVLTFVMIAIVSGIKEGWQVILHIENKHKDFDNLGMILATIRSVLICGIVSIGLLLSGNDMLVQSTHKSFIGNNLKDLSLNLYKGSYSVLIRHLSPHENLNAIAFELLSVQPDKKKEKLKKMNYGS